MFVWTGGVAQWVVFTSMHDALGLIQTGIVVNTCPSKSRPSSTTLTVPGQSGIQNNFAFLLAHLKRGLCPCLLNSLLAHVLQCLVICKQPFTTYAYFKAVPTLNEMSVLTEVLFCFVCEAGSVA